MAQPAMLRWEPSGWLSGSALTRPARLRHYSRGRENCTQWRNSAVSAHPLTADVYNGAMTRWTVRDWLVGVIVSIAAFVAATIGE